MSLVDPVDDSWRGSRYDNQCRALFDSVAATGHHPGLIYDYGQDGASLNQSVNTLVFVHRGGTLPISTKSGGLSTRTPFDDYGHIQARIRMRTGNECICVMYDLLHAIDEHAHGRAGVPEAYEISGGHAGSDGAQIDMLFRIKFLAKTDPLPHHTVLSARGVVKVADTEQSIPEVP